MPIDHPESGQSDNPADPDREPDFSNTLELLEQLCWHIFCCDLIFDVFQDDLFPAISEAASAGELPDYIADLRHDLQDAFRVAAERITGEASRSDAEDAIEDIERAADTVIKALIETAVVIGWPLGLWWLVQTAGLPAQATVFGALILLFVADKVFNFQAVLPIMTPVLLIGGMTTGVFTPTEGAIAACVWAIVLGFFWYRTLNFKMFVKICLDTVETTSTVLFIVAAASIFGWMLTATGVTTAIGQWVLGFTTEPWMFLLLANALMLFVGCFLEPTAAITILVPILVPICQQLGIDLVHFGLVMVLNLMIGLLHPPMGMVLFVLARVAKLSVERTTVAILPWLFPLLGSLVVITYIPSLVLWLPKQFF